MTKSKTSAPLKMMPVLLKFDYWTSDGRQPAGEVIDLPIDAATRIIEAGKADRADPMPTPDLMPGA